MKTSVSICCFTICCSAFLSFIPKSASAITITLGPVSVSELEDLFTSNGFEKPSITFNETETTLDLSILGKPVNGTGNFDTDFVSNFWRGKLSFSQTNPLFASDTLSASWSIFHQAGINRPHSSDELKGAIYTKAITINSNTAGTTSKLLSSPFNGKVQHPSEHFDEYSGLLSANVAANSVRGNNISNWTFELKGVHSVPEPLTIFGSGMALGFGVFFKKEYSKKQKKARTLA